MRSFEHEISKSSKWVIVAKILRGCKIPTPQNFLWIKILRNLKFSKFYNRQNPYIFFNFLPMFGSKMVAVYDKNCYHLIWFIFTSVEPVDLHTLVNIWFIFNDSFFQIMTSTPRVSKRNHSSLTPLISNINVGTPGPANAPRKVRFCLTTSKHFAILRKFDVPNSQDRLLILEKWLWNKSEQQV